MERNDRACTPSKGILVRTSTTLALATITAAVLASAGLAITSAGSAETQSTQVRDATTAVRAVPSTADTLNPTKANVEGRSDGSDLAKRTFPVKARYLGHEADMSIVGVYRVDEQGVISDEAALTYTRKLDHDGAQITEAAGTAVRPGEMLGDVLVKNPGPEMVRVYALVGAKLIEFDVAAGDGLLFGDVQAMSSQIAITHWCICTCDVPGSSDEVDEWQCTPTGNQPCDCAAFNGANCVDSQERKGTTKDCYYEMRFD